MHRSTRPAGGWGWEGYGDYAVLDDHPMRAWRNWQTRQI